MSSINFRKTTSRTTALKPESMVICHLAADTARKMLGGVLFVWLFGCLVCFCVFLNLQGHSVSSQAVNKKGFLQDFSIWEIHRDVSKIQDDGRTFSGNPHPYNRGIECMARGSSGYEP